MRHSNISVHAISMIYELRVLRSRAATILSREEGNLYVDSRTFDELAGMVTLADLLIRKIERTGEFIGDLQAALRQASVEAPAPADLGPDRVDRDSDH